MCRSGTVVVAAEAMAAEVAGMVAEVLVAEDTAVVVSTAVAAVTTAVVASAEAVIVAEAEDIAVVIPPATEARVVLTSELAVSVVRPRGASAALQAAARAKSAVPGVTEPIHLSAGMGLPATAV